MSIIIAVAGAKGGIAKSTTTACIACRLMEVGAKVLCCDADPQLSLSTWAAVGVENGYEVPVTVAMGQQLQAQLPQIAAGYDFTLIDCPPANGETQRAAIITSDVVLLPCGPSTVEVNAAVASADLIHAAKTVRPDLQAFMLITRMQPRTRLGKAVRTRLESLGVPVLAQPLSYRVDFQTVMDLGASPTQFKPQSPAADEVRVLVKELVSLINVDVEGVSHAA